MSSMLEGRILLLIS